MNWVIIGWGNGPSSVRRQTNTWTNDDWLAIKFLGTNFSEIWIRMLSRSFKKCIWQYRLPNRRPFCPWGDELSFVFGVCLVLACYMCVPLLAGSLWRLLDRRQLFSPFLKVIWLVGIRLKDKVNMSMKHCQIHVYRWSVDSLCQNSNEHGVGLVCLVDWSPRELLRCAHSMKMKTK